MAEKQGLFNGWEKIRQIGGGGQSSVFLVRSRIRAESQKNLLRDCDNMFSGIRNTKTLLENIAEYIREDAPDELGALKVFDKVRRDGAAPEERIRREIEILRAGHANLPKLFEGDSNAKWMVTEYFPNGSLEKSPHRFKGDVANALKAFRPLVATVAHLHAHHIIHRDIKPANIFLAEEGLLVLGDFGIAFATEGTERVTITQERVGPWDYMPQWADTGERLEEVKPSFDVYMLGKLLWCMISGRLRLPREYHRRPEYNLAMLFPNDRRMHSINSLLDRCIVEHEAECLQSANQLLTAIDEVVELGEKGLFLTETGEVALPCLVCGKGVYREETKDQGRVEIVRMNRLNERQNPIFLRSFCCDVCTHRAFFAPAFPDQVLQRTAQKRI